jgi:6-phosphogluconolactonase
MANPTRPDPNSSIPASSTPANSQITRRNFVAGAAALSLSAASGALSGTELLAATDQNLASKRILVGSGTPDGILSFAWDAATGTLTPEGIAGVISHSTWLQISPDRRFLYVACELDEFQGKPTGSVASFHVSNGKLTPISNVASHGTGTCHLTTDHTGHVVIAANYAGGSASSFVANEGKLGEAAWTEHYIGYPGKDGKAGPGPVADRQEAAHAHFASLSPDNRFVYINDLGADKIHIYTLNAATGVLSPAGTYHAKPGIGPRTLHFHRNGKIAYCVNELNSTVTVLQWNAADGNLNPIQTVNLLPQGTSTKHGNITNTGCDAVLTRDGRFAYFANRGDDFLMSFHIDPANGKLTPFDKATRTSCGGKTPRNFTLDPTERWILVANQGSSNLSVFARDPKTGELANEGKNVPAATPMCIVFV